MHFICGISKSSCLWKYKFMLKFMGKLFWENLKFSGKTPWKPKTRRIISSFYLYYRCQQFKGGNFCKYFFHAFRLERKWWWENTLILNFKILAAIFLYFTKRKPFTNYKKCFLFHWQNFFCFRDTWIFVLPSSPYFSLIGYFWIFRRR